jgi:hypothetical protein
MNTKKMALSISALALASTLSTASHAWFFETDVNVDVSKNQDFSAGGNITSESYNRSYDHSFNREGAHAIQGSVNNSVITGRGDGIKLDIGHNSVSSNVNMQMANSYGRGWGRERGATIGDNNLFGVNGAINNNMPMGDTYNTDNRYDYEEDNRIDNRK